MEFLKKYGLGIYLGATLGWQGINYTMMEFYIIIIPSIVLGLWGKK